MSRELNAMAKTIVKVWDKSYEIVVLQLSKTVWIAAGEYMGEQLRVKGLSERDAASQWREAARYKGN
jgi:hypothetical protein